MAQTFFPPELGALQEAEEQDESNVGGQTTLLRKLYFGRNREPQRDDKLDKKLARLVLDHARNTVAHPTRPQIIHHAPFVQHPFGDLALEESIEESPLLSEPQDYLVEWTSEKKLSCTMMLDCSSSMSGDKHLLASIAVAVLLLEVPAQLASVIVFASEGITVKKQGVQQSAEDTILKFLKTKPRGFTNIGRGLELGLEEAKRNETTKRRVGLIATDGRTTEGKDPIELAKLWDYLVVLHLHGPGSHLEASRAMAQAGNGVCLEVERFQELPRRLYDAVRLIARL